MATVDTGVQANYLAVAPGEFNKKWLKCIIVVCVYVRACVCSRACRACMRVCVCVHYA